MRTATAPCCSFASWQGDDFGGPQRLRRSQLNIIDSKVHGANMEPPGADRTQVGPHVGLVDLGIWDVLFAEGEVQ